MLISETKNVRGRNARMFFGALHFKTPDFTAEYLRTDIGISEYNKTELSYDWMNRHSNIKQIYI